jgi:hypothetical protein
VIVVKFDTATCRNCPVRDRCTTAARGGRQLTLRPQQLHQALARAEQTTDTWKSKYAIRAGAEATIHQAVTTGGMRRARYRGLPKVTLQHAFAAAAINLVRLHEWWTSPHLQTVRKASHLTRLDHALAA